MRGHGRLSQPLHKSRSEMKEGVGSGERAQKLVSFPLDCVGEVFSGISCCTLQIGGADARVNDGYVE